MLNFVSTTTLTYVMQANEKACFFVFVKNPGQKVAFYFAVIFNFVLHNLRFKAAVVLTLITLLLDQTMRKYLLEQRKGKLMKFLLLLPPENIPFVSLMACHLMRKRRLILK
jgi:hypothetical protein